MTNRPTSPTFWRIIISTESELFYPVLELPDDIRYDRYRRLIGLDEVKTRLRKEAAVLADPGVLTTWAATHHPRVSPESLAFTLLRDRAPLVVLAGDVGSGKSALAESFGCDLADHLDVPVTLYRLKLTARGKGHVGEMTTLVAEAFQTVIREAKLGRGADGRLRRVTIMVVDEADALVQSREATQMHHEDRAGVDAFLAGIGEFAGTGIPLLVVMCTNRLAALDPAVRRRAAAIFEFGRPDANQRRQVLSNALCEFDVSSETLEKLVLATGERGDGHPGFTFSDLTQRLVPTAILGAYPDTAMSADLLLTVAGDIRATPQFQDRPAT